VYNILLLGLVSFLTDVSTEMIYPLIPLYLVSVLGATPAAVGLIEGIAESLASLLKVFSGAVSDRLARRKPLALLGYGLSAFAKIPIIAAVSWAWVLWGRVGDRFGKGVRTAPRDALIAESAREGAMGSAFGLHRLLDTLGAVLGVTLAYYFFTRCGDYRSVFVWSLVPAFAGTAAILLVREAKRRRPAPPPGEKPLMASWPGRVLAGWRDLDCRLKKFLAVVFLFALGNSSNQFLILRAADLGFTAGDAVLLYLVFNIVYALASFPAGVLSDRIGRRVLLVAGYAVYGAVYLGMAAAGPGLAVWLLFGLYGLYSGATEGVEKALVAEMAPAEKKASLLGLHATLVGIGLFPASFLAGLLWKYIGPSAPFYFGGILGILAAAALLVVLAGGRTGRCA